MNSFPSEITHHIFGFLPPNDLAYSSGTCKHFYKAAHNENLPARLLIPKLNPKIIQENALTLWNFLEEAGSFNVDNDGRLVRIAFYHLFARISKWKDPESVIKKVNKIVEITFQEIYRLNQQGYITNPIDESFTPRRLYVWKPPINLSSECIYHPADYLADKILNSTQFVEPKIREAALLVQGQADKYEKISAKYWIVKNPDKRIVRVPRSDFRINEALFNSPSPFLW